MRSQRPPRKQPPPLKPPKTQQTRPFGRDTAGKPHKPITIPVPKRQDVEDALDRLIDATPDPLPERSER